MKVVRYIYLMSPLVFLLLFSCSQKQNQGNSKEIAAADILGNPEIQAISYGGYRHTTRDTQPTLEELKEDMRILHAADIRLLRTYNVTRPHAGNVLKAIRELKKEKPGFEMYVMLGAWIDCKNAWTDLPADHEKESPENAAEISRAIQLASEYEDIVKIIAVGNEAMVHWASSYYVHPKFILKWVRYLQEKKSEGVLPGDLWVTSSDNFASWGGGGSEYHLPELDSLISEVDFISLHTYPMHDTHYNPDFWGIKASEQDLPPKQQIDSCMQRALEYAQMQYYSVVDYMRSLGVEKPVHIGETGWASASNGHYGAKGSGACDEYKLGRYYHLIRQWTDQDEISCFFFEAFDEPWKDQSNPGGSENHFGLFTVHGHAKFPLWPYVDQGAFKQLSRGGHPIEKTYDGRMDSLFATVIMPPIKSTQQTEMTKE